MQQAGSVKVVIGACSGALRRRVALGALAMLAALPAGVSAQTGDWPNKPIRLVVNFPPGSSPDIVGRAVAGPLGQALGQSVVIENRAGAGGTVGVEVVARSAPDGYTILMTAGSTMSIGPHVYSKLPYNPVKDLTPVAAAARIENYLVVRADLPVKTYAEFAALLRKSPGKFSYGSAGSGTSLHIAAEMWLAAAGLSAVHVPYKGSAPAITDMLGGHIDFMFDSGSAFPHVKSGKFLALAVAAPARVPMYPDIPTLEELGVKGTTDSGTTHSFYAPAGTPAAIVERLNREINKALTLPAVIAQIQGLGAQATPMSVEGLRALMEADSKRYAAVVKQVGIKAD
jgi:tripartite-type tricarboxylate transporter receptor subunit TctC